MSDLRIYHAPDEMGSSETNTKIIGGAIVVAVVIAIGAVAYSTGAFNSQPNSVVADNRLPDALPPAIASAPLPAPAAPVVAPEETTPAPVTSSVRQSSTRTTPRVRAPADNSAVEPSGPIVPQVNSAPPDVPAPVVAPEAPVESTRAPVESTPAAPAEQ